MLLNCAIVAAITSGAYYAVLYFDAFLWRSGWHPLYLIHSQSELWTYRMQFTFCYDAIRFGVFGFLAGYLIFKLRPKALSFYCLVSTIALAYLLEIWSFGVNVPGIYFVYLVTIPLVCGLLAVHRSWKVRA